MDQLKIKTREVCDKIKEQSSWSVLCKEDIIVPENTWVAVEPIEQVNSFLRLQ